MPAADKSLADRLVWLIRRRERERGKPLTSRQIAEGVEQMTGVAISHAYIQRLRNGETANPRLEHLEALAKFFGVSPAYWVEDDVTARKIQEQLELLSAIRDSGIIAVAMRMNELTPSGIRAVRQIVETMIQHEQESHAVRERPQPGDGEG